MGQEKPYVVKINEKEHFLDLSGAIKIEILEGGNIVSVLAKDLNIPDQSFEIETTFFEKNFNSDVYVLNPDRMAFLYNSQVTYAVKEQDAVAYTGTIHTGKLLHIFQDIDYAFKDFPDEVSMPKGKKTVVKRGLSVYQPRNYGDEFQVLTDYLEKDKLFEYLKVKFKTKYNDSSYIDNAYVYLEASQFIELAKPYLEIRPFSLNLHRNYQNATEIAYPEKDILGKYQTLLAKNPNSSELKYLVGRLEYDLKKADKLFLESEQGDKPIGRGYVAIAYSRLITGRFSEGLKFAQKASDILEDDESLLVTHSALQLALKKYRDLLAKAEARQLKNPEDWGVVSLKIQYLILLGEKAKANAISQAFVESLREQKEDEKIIQHWSDFVELSVAYAEGDLKKYDELLPKVYSVGFRQAIRNKDLKKLEEIFNSEPSAKYYQDLLSFLVANSKGDSKAENLYLGRAVEKLSRGNRSERLVGEWLEGKTKLNLQNALDASIWPDHKVVVLVSLGIKYPRYKKELFALAKKLNYRPNFPNIFVGEIIKSNS